MPVVELEVGTYDHDDYGVVSFPIFKIADWTFWDRNDEVKKVEVVAHAIDDAVPFAPEWRG